MKCIYCGWNNPKTVTFCRKCGVRLTDAQREESSSSLSSSASSTTGPLFLPTPRQDVLRPPKRRARWRLVWIVLILLLVGGAGLTWWLVNASQPTVAVSQTLTTYCDALERGDYQQAYEQWTNFVRQQTMNEADFAYPYQHRPKIMKCTVNNVSENNSSASGSISFYFADGSTTNETIGLVLENGVWRIVSQSSN